MASDPRDASPSSGSSGDVSPLGRVYNFFVDAPAWILSGMGLVVTFAQVLWVANLRLDLAMRVIQVADRSTLLIMAVYQIIFFAGFLVMVGFPGYYLRKSVSQVNESGWSLGKFTTDFVVALVSSSIIDVILFFAMPWIPFSLGSIYQCCVFFIWLISIILCLCSALWAYLVKLKQKKGGEDGSGKQGGRSGDDKMCRCMLNLLKILSFCNGRGIVLAVMVTLIVAILVPGLWFPSQKITYKTNERPTSGVMVGEVVGENEGGVVVVRDGEMVVLKNEDIIREEYCRRSLWWVNSSYSAFLVYRGSNIPDCLVV